MHKYLQSFPKDLLTLSHAFNYEHPGLFNGSDIEICTGVNEFISMEKIMKYQKTPVPLMSMAS